jgi:hypothetical protein
MATEPITILSQIAAPTKVLAAVRSEFPAAQVVGEDGPRWREIILTFGDTADTKRLTLTHDPDIYTGPGWPDRLGAVRACVAQFPIGDRLPLLLSLIGSFRFAVGTRFDPDYTNPASDPRFGVIVGLAGILDGVIYAPSSLWDGCGRLIANVCGRMDPEAVWPGAAAGGVTAPPTPARVAKQAVALMAVTARAVIEREIRRARIAAHTAVDMHSRLVDWVKEIEIDTALEPRERDMLAVQPGELAEPDAVAALWRVEGLEVLGWAMGRSPFPRYDKPSNIDDVWKALGFLDTPNVQKLLKTPMLRSHDELDSFYRQMRGYHWRMRQVKQHGPRMMNFRTFSENNPMAPFDLLGFHLIDDDLSFRGKRMDEASEKVLLEAAQIARERHLAASWVCRGPDIYSLADIST